MRVHPARRQPSSTAGIGEGEGLVTGDREVLPKRRQGAFHGRACDVKGQGPSESLQAIEVDVLRYDRRRPVEERLQRAVLHRLHQPQMPARQLECRLAWDAAQDLHPGQRPSQDLLMARTADTVEDDARDLDVGPEVLEPQGQCRDGRTHAPHVHDQHDWQGERRCKVGRAAAAVGRTVEQARHALDYGKLAVHGGRQRRSRGLRPHRPGVEAVGRPAGRRCEEGRVDIVGADLERMYA